MGTKPEGRDRKPCASARTFGKERRRCRAVHYLHCCVHYCCSYGRIRTIFQQEPKKVAIANALSISGQKRHQGRHFARRRKICELKYGTMSTSTGAHQEFALNNEGCSASKQVNRYKRTGLAVTHPPSRRYSSTRQTPERTGAERNMLRNLLLTACHLIPAGTASMFL